MAIFHFRIWRYLTSEFGDLRFPNYNTQEAIDYFQNLYQRALHIEDSLGISRDRSFHVLSRLSAIYSAMKLWKEALPIFYQLLEWLKNSGANHNEGLIYCKYKKMYGSFYMSKYIFQ